MNIHMIACQVFYREISYLAATSPNTTTVTWIPQGLHDTPDLLRKRVMEEICRLEQDIENKVLKRNPDIILLGYGMCSNGVVGISSRLLPIAVPRTDDCIGVFLGSQKRYLEVFQAYPGTYWLNNGWMESAFLPTKENYKQMYQDYAELYGEDNAEFLMENEKSWITKYGYCGYITSPIYQKDQGLAAAREVADYCKWDFIEFPGDCGMLARLLNGQFLEEEVLVCPPGFQIAPSFDEKKLVAAPL